MRSHRPEILITGFGPFPGVPVNVSGELAEALARRAAARFPKYGFRHLVLPVSWTGAPVALARAMACQNPMLMLHFGVSERATGFVVETCGRNEAQCRPDHTAALPSSACLIDDAAAVRSVSIPANRIATRLAQRGYPVTLSDDAGGYLCNALLYHSLTLACSGARTRRRHLAGFIHIPATIAATGTKAGAPDALTWQRLLDGGLEIVAVSLAALHRR